MDEERLGIGVIADPSGFDDLEDQYARHLDTLEQESSGRVIEGPTVRVPPIDTHNIEEATQTVRLFDRELREVSQSANANVIALNTGHLKDDLEGSLRSLERFGAVLSDVVSSTNAFHGIHLAETQQEIIAATRAILALPDDLSRGANVAAERLDEIRSRLQGLRENIRDIEGGRQLSAMFDNTLTAVDTLQGKLTELGTARIEPVVAPKLDEREIFNSFNRLASTAFGATTRTSLERALDPSQYRGEVDHLADLIAQGLERAPDRFGRALTQSTQGFISALPQEVAEALAEGLQQRGVVEIPFDLRPDPKASTVAVSADTKPFEADVAAARTAAAEQPPVNLRVEANPNDFATILTALDEQTQGGERAGRAFEALRDNIREAMDTAGASVAATEDAVARFTETLHSGSRTTEENAARLHDAIAALRTLAAEPATETNLIDTTSDTGEVQGLSDSVSQLQSKLDAVSGASSQNIKLTADPEPAKAGIAEVEGAVRDLVKTANDSAIVLRLDPASADLLNRALAESRVNAELARQNFEAFAASAGPELRALGATAEEATVRLNRMWDDMLRGRVSVQPATDAVHGLGEEMATTERETDEMIRRLDEFNRTARATGQVGGVLAPRGVAPPPVPPANESPDDRNARILSEGLFDVTRAAEQARAKVASLRDTMLSTGQAFREVRGENKAAAQEISELGARLRQNTQHLHDSEDALTFHGLATRKATSALVEMASESLEVRGPIIGLAEAIGEVTLGHGPLLALVAAVAALGAAWRLVAGPAHEAASAEREALEAFEKQALALRFTEDFLLRQTRSRAVILANSVELNRQLRDEALHHLDIGDALARQIRLMVDRNALEETQDALAAKTADTYQRQAEALNAARINAARGGIQSTATLQSQLRTNAEQQLQQERQAALALSQLQTLSIADQLSQLRARNDAAERIDAEFFENRRQLARQAAVETRANLEAQIDAERQQERLLTPRQREAEGEAGRADRQARIDQLRAQVNLQDVILRGQLAQIDAEQQLGRRTRETAEATAALADAEREHQARVERAAGRGNTTAGFGGLTTVGVAVVPTLPPDALELTNEQLRRLEAVVDPVTVPLILAPASQRETLDLVHTQAAQIFEEAQAVARAADLAAQRADFLHDRIAAIGDAATNLTNVAEELNVISEAMRTTIDQAFTLAGAIGGIGSAAAEAREAAARQEAAQAQRAAANTVDEIAAANEAISSATAAQFAATLHQIQAIGSVISSAIGLVTGVVNALVGGESAHDRILRENTEAIERNTAAQEVQARFGGPSGQLDFARRADEALRAFFAQAAEREEAINTLVSQGIERTIAELQVGPPPSLEGELNDLGISLQDLQVIADQFGLTVVDNGHIVADALTQLDAEIRRSIDAQFRWQNTFDDQERRLRLASRLSGEEQSPEAEFRRRITAAINAGATAIGDAFQGVDFGDPEAVRRALQALEDQFNNANSDLDQQIGRLSRDDFIRFLEEGADFLDSFNEGVKDATAQLEDLNIPEGFRRAAIAFETGNRGSPFPEPTTPDAGGHTPGTGLPTPQIDPRRLEEHDLRISRDETAAAAQNSDREQRATREAGDETVVAVQSSTTRIVDSIGVGNRTLDAILRTLQGDATAAPAGRPPTGLQANLRTAPTTGVGVTGGLHVHVHLPPGATPAQAPALRVAFEKSMREALRNIGLVQSGDTLQFPLE